MSMIRLTYGHDFDIMIEAKTQRVGSTKVSGVTWMIPYWLMKVYWFFDDLFSIIKTIYIFTDVQKTS